MAISQERSKRKSTGGRYIASHKKKLHEVGSVPTLTKVGDKRTQKVRVLGAQQKDRLLSVDVANVMDPKTKKSEKLKIKTISDNPANRNFIRRNIITKGAIIETEKGKARVTSRPGQEGTVNAVLI